MSSSNSFKIVNSTTVLLSPRSSACLLIGLINSFSNVDCSDFIMVVIIYNAENKFLVVTMKVCRVV